MRSQPPPGTMRGTGKQCHLPASVPQLSPVQKVPDCRWPFSGCETTECERGQEGAITKKGHPSPAELKHSGRFKQATVLISKCRA